MYLSEIGFENVKWTEMAQDCVQWLALALAVLNLQVLLTEFSSPLRHYGREFLTCYPLGAHSVLALLPVHSAYRTYAVT
jgi:hypothetical protein